MRQCKPVAYHTTDDTTETRSALATREPRVQAALPTTRKSEMTNKSDTKTTESEASGANLDTNEHAPKGKTATQLVRPEHVLKRAESAVKVVAVRRPVDNRYFRTHPDDDYWFPLYVVDVPNQKRSETHLVMPEFYDEFGPGLVQVVTAITFVDRHHNPGLWLYRGTPDSDNTWHKSALEVAYEARVTWLRIVNEGDQYVGERAVDQSLEPRFPEVKPYDLAMRAFKGKVVDRTDHSAIATLQGGN